MDILQADDASLLDPESVCEATPFGDRLEDALDVLVELDGPVARLLLLEEARERRDHPPTVPSSTKTTVVRPLPASGITRCSTLV